MNRNNISNSTTTNATHISQQEDDIDNDIDDFDTTPLPMNYTSHSTSFSSFKPSRRSSSVPHRSPSPVGSSATAKLMNGTMTLMNESCGNGGTLPSASSFPSSSLSRGGDVQSFSLPPQLLSSSSAIKRHRRSMSI